MKTDRQKKQNLNSKKSHQERKERLEKTVEREIIALAQEKKEKR